MECRQRKQDLGAIYISLGSNEGQPQQWLATALEALAQEPDLRIGAVSSVYSTEPQGMRDQPWFANQVAELHCAPELGPRALLTRLLTLETRLGRTRSQDPALRFGPRRIDLDLLLYADVVLDEPGLVVPHPRLCQRAFVLVPLRELAPDLVFPDGRRIDEVLETLSYAVEGFCIHQ